MDLVGPSVLFHPFTLICFMAFYPDCTRTKSIHIPDQRAYAYICMWLTLLIINILRSTEQPSNARVSNSQLPEIYSRQQWPLPSPNGVVLQFNFCRSMACAMHINKAATGHFNEGIVVQMGRMVQIVSCLLLAINLHHFILLPRILPPIHHRWFIHYTV